MDHYEEIAIRDEKRKWGRSFLKRSAQMNVLCLYWFVGICVFILINIVKRLRTTWYYTDPGANQKRRTTKYIKVCDEIDWLMTDTAVIRWPTADATAALNADSSAKQNKNDSKK